MNGPGLLTVLTLVPLLGGLVVIGLGRERARLARGLTWGVSGVAFAVALGLWLQFDPDQAGYQFEEDFSWIPTLGVNYHLGLDGLGLLMVGLTALVVPLSLGASARVTGHVPLFSALVLFLQAGLFGTFTALNFFHWFLFWELSLVPAFFLVRLWGGPRRQEAATQFFVYTMVGSVAMLLAFLAIFQATGVFDFPALAALGRSGELAQALSTHLTWPGLAGDGIVWLVFGGVFLGLAVKVPVWPLHTWLPLAYAEAPSSVTMLLTGVMSKMGVYGFLRLLLPIFPGQVQTLATPLLLLAVLTIVASAWTAMAQTDLKRMLAYSSINHLGYCLLGMFAAAGSGPGAGFAAEQVAALDGVLLQMFNHGLTAATLFAGVGFLEQRTGGCRGVHDFGGLRRVAPVFTGLLGIALFASLGLPGLNGFVGEFLIFKGSLALAPGATAVSVLGLLGTAIFLLTLMQRVFHGPLAERWQGFPDLDAGERWVVAPAVGLMLGVGVYPQLLLGPLNATVLEWVRQWTGA